MDNEPPPNPTPAAPAPPSPPPPPLPPMIPPGQKPKRGRGWKIATLVLAILLALSMLSNVSHIFFDALLSSAGTGAGSDVRLQEITIENNNASDKIAVIPVEGIITSSSIDGGGYNMVNLIEDQLKLAAKDHRVKAVLLKVNSPGGEVLASDDIYNALLRFQREHDVDAGVRCHSRLIEVGVVGERRRVTGEPSMLFEDLSNFADHLVSFELMLYRERTSLTRNSAKHRSAKK